MKSPIVRFEVPALVCTAATGPVSRTASIPILRSIAFIEESFAERVGLAAIAAAAGLSISRFATRFSDEVGVSPYRYLCRVRIYHAQRMLRAGVPPSAVATAVGFFDQSHLGRHFRRMVGTTPKHYMKVPRNRSKLG
ncbi:transcriptional regulator, AraC family [Burkholderia sp. OK233]|nr:transcriptional regulator, AraC family [Burkholderia sp. OK233]